MKPVARNLLAAFIIFVVVSAWISIATVHADNGPTAGARWALDCQAQFDSYAMRHHAGDATWLESVRSNCANSGQNLDDGVAQPNVADGIAKFESTSTTMGWGVGFKH